MAALTQIKGDPVCEGVINDHADLIDGLEEGFFARYVKGSTQGTFSADFTAVPVTFPTAQDTTSGVTASGTGNNKWTLNEAGLWSISTDIRVATTAAASSTTVPVEAAVWIVNGDNDVFYDGGHALNHGTGTGAKTLLCSAEVTRRFDAGDDIQILCFVVAASNTSNTCNLTALDDSVYVECEWLGP